MKLKIVIRILVIMTNRNLKMTLKKENILQHIGQKLDTPQSIERQNKGPKEHDEKYIACW